jgi:hypothetical protein
VIETNSHAEIALSAAADAALVDIAPHPPNPDAASRASRTVVVGKQAQRFDAGAAAALLRLAVPKLSGPYLRPLPITEILTTNLLPVTEMPPVTYAATSAVGDYKAGGRCWSATTVGGRSGSWVTGWCCRSRACARSR